MTRGVEVAVGLRSREVTTGKGRRRGKMNVGAEIPGGDG